MTNLLIRPIVASDEKEWRRLWTGYLDYYETSVTEEVYQTSFARLLAGGENQFQGYLALLDDQPCGLVHFLFHRHMWKIDNVCYLQDLFTDKSTRGKGVGRALIKAVYAAADVAGSPSVYWLTQEFNYAGRMLYDQIGTKTPFIRYNRG